jgi:hypothetical protein
MSKGLRPGSEAAEPPALRLLKFDSVYPVDFLKQKQNQVYSSLLEKSYEEYYQWLIDCRMGFSDFLTYPMNKAGWSAREVVASDDMLLRKLPITAAPPIWKQAGAFVKHLARASIKDMLTLRAFGTHGYTQRWQLLERHINWYRPDVIFIREPSHVDGLFWERFRSRCLIVGFIGCNTKDAWHWNAHRHDVIFSLTEEYQKFFEAVGIQSHLFSYGVDERMALELADETKKHDCTFVGYLGIPSQRAKTALLEAVAKQTGFKWWGVKGPEIAAYPALVQSWQGSAAGIDMFRVYKQSRIVINDYGDVAMGRNVNIRTMEVLGVGSFLLTRAASNIEWLEEAGALVTFRSPEDCVNKIKHYLTDAAGREKIAAQGLRTALEHFNYRDIAHRVMEIIAAAYEKKRSSLKPWSAN